jgi:hypothetical protein
MHFWQKPGNWQKNWQAHGSDYEDNNLLKCDATQYEISVPTSEEPATLHHLPWWYTHTSIYMQGFAF